MKKQKNQSGITLIALVITIIVLLILAGVSLRLVAGNEGILNRAESAVDKSNTETLKEEIEIAISEARIAYYDGDKEQGATSADDNIIKKLQKGLETSKGTVILDSNGKLSLNGSEIGSYSTEGGLIMSETTEEEKITIVEGTRDEWEILEDGVLSRYKGEVPENGTIIIPNVVDGISVKKLQNGSDATVIFEKNSSGLYGVGITNVVISEGISEIGAKAMMMMNDLKTISIPSSVNIIGQHALMSDGLTTINYEGTKAQWNKITIGQYNNLENVMIVCSDGRIEK